jgi:YVTN family beta-propeller protein
MPLKLRNFLSFTVLTVIIISLFIQNPAVVNAANCDSVQVGTFPISSTAVGTNLYINNQQSNNVSVFDTISSTVIATIPVGIQPTISTVVGSDLYVVNSQGNSVSVIDTNSNTVSTTIPIGGFYQSTGQDDIPYINNKIFINTNAGVKVISTITNTVIATYPGFYGVTTHSTIVGDNIYISSYDNYSNPGSVYVFNTNTNAFVANITVGVGPATSTQVGNKLYVNNTNSSFMTVIDLATNTLAGTIANASGGYYNHILVGNKLYISAGNANYLKVLDTNTDTLLNNIPLSSSNPFNMIKVGNYIYVDTFDYPRSLSIVDTTNDTFVKTIPNSLASNFYVTSVANKVYILRAYSNDISVLDATTNLMDTFCMIGTPLPILGTPGSAFPIITLLGNTMNNGTAGTFTPFGSATTISGVFQNGTFVPTSGSIIPLDVATGNVQGTLSAFGAKAVSISTKFTLPIPDLTVKINQAGIQADATNNGLIKFTAIFSETIDVNSFDTGDILLSGTAPTKYVTNVTQTTPNDGTTFEITTSVTGDGTVVADIPAGNFSGYSTNSFGTVYNGYNYSVAVDQNDNVYTPNWAGNTITKTTPNGITSTFGTTGSNPNKLVFDGAGNLYVSNFSDSNITKITPGGVSSIYGTTGQWPMELKFDTAGNLFTVNRGANNITKITPSGVTTNYGTLGYNPFDFVIDPSGNLYVINYSGSDITKVTPSGVSTTLASNIQFPTSILMDPNGDLLVTSSNYAGTIERITPTGVVSTFATGLVGPSDMVFDNNGNIFVSNESGQTISKVDSSGQTTTYASAGTSPKAIDINSKGNIYTASYASGISNIAQHRPVLANGIKTAKNKANKIATFTDNSVTLDTTPPSNPVLVVPVTTISQTPVIIGQCEVGLNLIILVTPTNETLPSVCTSTGDFSVTPTTPIPVGNYSVVVTQSDQVGNTSISATQGGVIIQATTNPDLDGDGLSNTLEGIYGTNPNTVDTDSDGANDFIEYSGPNNGDFNNNGIADGIESGTKINVGTNGELFGLETSGPNCSQISSSRLVAESTLTNLDALYSYPNGLIDYKLLCATRGDTTLVNLYFFNQSYSPELKVRKFKNGEYSFVSNESIKNLDQVSIGNINTVKLTYIITDGGELDQDSLANGQIIDPIGLALLETATGNGETPSNSGANGNQIQGLIRTGGQN